MYIVVKRFWSCRSLWQRLIAVTALTAVGLLPLIVLQLAAASRVPGRKAVTKAALITGKDRAAQSRLAASYGKLPLSFELNAGQTDASVRFLSRGPGYALFLTGNDAVLSLAKPRHLQIKAPIDLRSGASAFPPFASLFVRPPGPKPAVPGESPIPEPAAVRMSLAGANRNTSITGLDELPGKSNYFIGNDPAKWRTNVPTYAKVKYQSVYPGIDLVYYGNPQQLEYDFLVAPGADPKEISLDVTAIGSSSNGGWKPSLRVDANGDLVMQADEDEVRLHKPVVYQAGEGSSRRFVDGHYVLKGDNRVSFEVASYDPGKVLVIDPVLSFSSYLGGSDSDFGFGIAVDSAGNAYVTGSTKSTNFPTANPLQAVLGGGTVYGDAFVAKLNPAGTALIYSTYLGGNGEEDGYGIAADSAGNAYVTGSTSSTNFPTVSPVQAVFGGSYDAFVAKLNPAGSALVYSTYLGGSAESFGSAVAVDFSGNAYVTGYTYSTDFPIANPLQAVLNGPNDAYIAKLNPAGSALVYSTYLGGGGFEIGYAIAVDSAGNAYVTGSTTSIDFPTASPLQAVYGGGEFDAFVAKLNAAGSALVYSTYLGGTSADVALGIGVDSSGNAYVTGGTTSTDLPTANPLQAAAAGEFDAFVSKLNPSGSALVYSTYLGGSSRDVGNGIAVDSTGSAYVIGYTRSTDFPTADPLQTFSGSG
jgi:hypothetical protein